MFLCICSVECLPEQAQLWPVFEHANHGCVVTRNAHLHMPPSRGLANGWTSWLLSAGIRDEGSGIPSVITLLHEPVDSVDPPRREKCALIYDTLLFFPE